MHRMDRKFNCALPMILLVAFLSGCSLLDLFPGFRIRSVGYYKSGSPRATSGNVVNYDVEILYDASNVVKIDFYYTFGQDYQEYWAITPGSGPNYVHVGSEIEFDGIYTFDTSFTQLNWVTVKGVALKSDGQVIEDKLWFNIDNRGPEIFIDPRDCSVVDSLDSFTVSVWDGGYSLGTNYDATSIELRTSANTVIPLGNKYSDGNGNIMVSLPAGLPDGKYSIQVKAYDAIGNDSILATSFTVSSNRPTPPVIDFIMPSWNGTTISGTVTVQYSSTMPLKELWLDLSYSGTRTPYIWGYPPSIQLPPIQSGTISIDTRTITGRNTCFFRLFGIAENGSTAFSNSILRSNIDNLSQ